MPKLEFSAMLAGYTQAPLRKVSNDRQRIIVVYRISPYVVRTTAPPMVPVCRVP